jgi:NAD(P)-dependent dehydrogenase (short-subunit alcohol dehydrogenase family)
MKGLGISAAVFGTSAYLLRRRISKQWLDYRSTPHDLSGKTIFITGGNTGLGYEAAKDFAQRNARVIIACRSPTKGRDAVNLLRNYTENPNIECLELDLASLDSVREFVENVKLTYSKIDALICNAGVWLPPSGKEVKQHMYKTKDGFEIHFGVNHLSHFLLCQGLTELLKKSENGRIVWVSSSLMRSAKINFDRHDHVYEARKLPEGENSHAPPAYCDTKLMNALTCRHMATKLPSSVTTYSVSPGWCRSSLGRHSGFSLLTKIAVSPIMFMVQRSSQQGAQNIIFATLQDQLKSGEMYKDGEIAKEEIDFIDSLGEKLPEKLWELSEQLLKA